MAVPDSLHSPAGIHVAVLCLLVRVQRLWSDAHHGHGMHPAMTGPSAWLWLKDTCLTTSTSMLIAMRQYGEPCIGEITLGLQPTMGLLHFDQSEASTCQILCDALALW